MRTRRSREEVLLWAALLAVLGWVGGCAAQRAEAPISQAAAGLAVQVANPCLALIQCSEFRAIVARLNSDDPADEERLEIAALTVPAGMGLAGVAAIRYYAVNVLPGRYVLVGIAMRVHRGFEPRGVDGGPPWHILLAPEALVRSSAVRVEAGTFTAMGVFDLGWIGLFSDDLSDGDVVQQHYGAELRETGQATQARQAPGQIGLAGGWGFWFGISTTQLHMAEPGPAQNHPAALQAQMAEVQKDFAESAWAPAVSRRMTIMEGRVPAALPASALSELEAAKPGRRP